HEGDNEPTGEKMNPSGGYVEVESGIPYESVRELRKKGHDMRFDVGGYGGYQAIKVEMHDGRRVYVGASESRKDGQAAGYWALATIPSHKEPRGHKVIIRNSLC